MVGGGGGKMLLLVPNRNLSRKVDARVIIIAVMQKFVVKSAYF